MVSVKNIYYIPLTYCLDEMLKPVLLRNRKLKCLDLTNCTKLSEGIMQVDISFKGIFLCSIG